MDDILENIKTAVAGMTEQEVADAIRASVHSESIADAEKLAKFFVQLGESNPGY